MVEVIFNGGKPLKDCPKSFEQGEKWTNAWNEALPRGTACEWKFDCGFKLDFDGNLMSISSRFYPPKETYGPNWDGSMSLYIGDQLVATHNFECGTIDELRNQVEAKERLWREDILSILVAGLLDNKRRSDSDD